MTDTRGNGNGSGGEVDRQDEENRLIASAGRATDRGGGRFGTVGMPSERSENFGATLWRLGEILGREAPADADLVCAVPDSSNTAALGFARATGLPFELALIRNHYVGRTFISPAQKVRDMSVRIKFNPVAEVVDGKRVVVIDDSIVRGTTMRKLVKLIRSAGAVEVVEGRVLVVVVGASVV